MISRKAIRRALACAAAGATLALVPAADAGENQQATLPAELFLGGFGNPCNGESFVNVQGNIHIVAQVVGDTTTNDYHQVVHFNTQSVTAVGAITGTKYTLTNSNNNVENVHPESARAFTGEVTLQAISRNSIENFQIHDIVHFTTNANGEPTATVIGGHADCRG